MATVKKWDDIPKTCPVCQGPWGWTELNKEHQVKARDGHLILYYEPVIKMECRGNSRCHNIEYFYPEIPA